MAGLVLEYKQKAALMKFMIKIGFATLQSYRCAKIFKPLPPSWIIRGITADTAIATLKLTMDYEAIISAIDSVPDDDALITRIGEETYSFIKFLITSSNAISIENCHLLVDSSSSSKPTSATEIPIAEAIPAEAHSTTAAAATSKLLSNRFKQFKLTYSVETERHFKSKKTVFRYHGTPAENLWPIIANGLKNCSGTELQLNGAAHGKGIYLSDSIEFSTAYCRALPDGNLAMLIYEVIDDPKWFKSTNIYVVDDESALILRYIIIITSYNASHDSKIFQGLDEFLNSGKLKENEMKKESAKVTALTKAYNKRLMMEYKKIANTSPDILGFTLQLAAEDNLRVWIIRIMKLDNPALETQMQRLNIPYIEMEITFPEAYPIDPPFPRILYPRFQSQTGHITSGGSICMEAISASGWVPTTNIESLITQIKLVLAEGSARIDESAFNKRYSMAEALDAFKYAMAVHGW